MVRSPTDWYWVDLPVTTTKLDLQGAARGLTLQKNSTLQVDLQNSTLQIDLQGATRGEPTKLDLQVDLQVATSYQNSTYKLVLADLLPYLLLLPNYLPTYLQGSTYGVKFDLP